jgi:hypothetical protein
VKRASDETSIVNIVNKGMHGDVAGNVLDLAHDDIGVWINSLTALDCIYRMHTRLRTISLSLREHAIIDPKNLNPFTFQHET